MTKKVLQVITDALEEIGAMGEGVPPAPEDMQKALRVLQMMHDSDEAERLMLYTVARATFALTASQQTRTIGAGGNFDTGANTERPVFIEHVGVTPVGQTMEIPIVPYESREEWLAEPFKALTDLYPRRYWYEPTYPLGTFTFWPVPTTAATVAIATAVRLTSPAGLTTDLAFPPGYHEAWHYNLAKRLQRPFRKPQDPSLATDAKAALGRVKRLNDPGPPRAQVDAALIAGGGGFDIYSNRHRR